ncbi:MAG: MAPEG family protein [Pseudoxanthomonas sp.]
MKNLLGNPAFIAYAITCLALCANLLVLWVYSGVARGKVKVSLNKEDMETFGGSLAEIDPPKVARILRAHSNASASIYPFLSIGLIYLLAGGTAGTAAALFGIFTFARVLHSFAYLNAKQPWRTISFVTGLLATVVLMLVTSWLILRAA